MKKVLAVLLSVLMLAAAVPAVFAAETVTYSKSQEYLSSHEIETGKNYVIPSGIKMTVPSTLTLYVPAGAKLVVEAGGTLDVLGTVVVNKGGELRVDGKLGHGGNVTVEEGAIGVVAVSVDAISNYLSDNISFNKSPYSLTVTAAGFDYEDPASGKPKQTDVTAGGKFYAQINTDVSVIVNIAEPFNAGTKKEETKFDESKIPVLVDGAVIPFVQGAVTFNVPDSCRVTFGKAQYDADYYRTCRIYLPSGTGYRVVGRNGECGEDGTVYVNYGSSFSFRVELDDTYDRSALEVVCYSGYGYFGLEVPEGEYLKDAKRLEADESGYYTIFIDGEKTVQVEGSLDNNTISKVTNIMDIFKYIIEMIRSFFDSIMSFFNGGN